MKEIHSPSKVKGDHNIMSDDKKYNGWSNYETWNVALWLDNEQSSYQEMHGLADEVWLDAVPSASFTKEEQALLTLSDRIKVRIEENMPDLGASCYADLLNAAIGEVDWREIAEHYLDDVDKTEETEEEEVTE